MRSRKSASASRKRPLTPLAKWLAGEPKGAMSRLWRESGVSWDTVHRAKKGELVGLEMAIRLSRCTRVEVPVAALVKNTALANDIASLAVA